MKSKMTTLTICIIVSFTLIGCNQKEKTIEETAAVQETTVTQETMESSIAEITDLDEKSGILELKIGFANKLGADIGMISLIDPVTNEQINISELLDGEVMCVNSYFPRNVKELQWAVYNMNGDLYAESKTDITQASESVWIILEGDKEVEQVESLFDLTEEEVKNKIN